MCGMSSGSGSVIVVWVLNSGGMSRMRGVRGRARMLIYGLMVHLISKAFLRERWPIWLRAKKDEGLSCRVSRNVFWIRRGFVERRSRKLRLESVFCVPCLRVVMRLWWIRP